jgi:nitroreductase
MSEGQETQASRLAFGKLEGPNGDATVDTKLRKFVLAAGQAPSGDNTQPWRFNVDPDAHSIALYVDESRDRSPMNAGQRMARIAVGAALENLLRVAQGSGWTAELEREPGSAAAVVHFSGGGEAAANTCEWIAARVTNRRTYDGRAVPGHQLDQLARQTPALDEVTTHWIVGKDRIGALARVIGLADAAMFAEPSMRRAFLANVRFDEPPSAPVAQGLSLDSLELAASDRQALRIMARVPDWLFNVAGAKRVFAAKARQLVESASGLCLIAARDGAPQTDLAVGRVMQRAWLALTELGLAVQPMSSLLVLENALEHGGPALIAVLGSDRVRALCDEFRALAPEVAGGRLAFLLRFGYAAAPSGRTGRLPLEAIMTSAAPASSTRPAYP